jgi:hypothetical protein
MQKSESASLLRVVHTFNFSLSPNIVSYSILLTPSISVHAGRETKFHTPVKHKIKLQFAGKGYYKLKSSVVCVITRREVVLNRRFGATYRSHLQASRCLGHRTSWHLKMGHIDSSETSVSKSLEPHNKPEDGRIQFNRCGSLQSRVVTKFGNIYKSTKEVVF